MVYILRKEEKQKMVCVYFTSLRESPSQVMAENNPILDLFVVCFVQFCFLAIPNGRSYS